MEALGKIFTSLKLTISLLIILALVSVIGTLILQNASPDQYLRHYSHFSYTALKTLGFLDVYHSWWFILLLILLCFNLLACSMKNLSRTWKTMTQSDLILHDDQIKILPLVATMKKDFSLEEAKRKVVKILEKHFASPKEILQNETYHIFAEKSKYSRLGIYITHASVIIILIGGMVGSIFGFKGNVNILEGRSADRIMIRNNHSVRELGFKVRCDNFEVTYYPNGAPKDYKSTLTILKDGEKVITKTIEVNHPLKYKGVVFYQASYGTAPGQGGELIIEVKKRGSKDPGRQVSVEVGDSFSLPDQGLTVKVKRFFTDFAMDNNEIIVNRSSELNNPAAELLILKDGAIQNRTWVFQKFPDFHGGKKLDYQFSIKGFKGKEYTGLQVAKDPGVWVVWIGCTLMIIGIISTFYFSHRKVWIRLRREGEKLDLLMAGTSGKNRLAFEKEFQKLEDKIQRL